LHDGGGDFPLPEYRVHVFGDCIASIDPILLSARIVHSVRGGFLYTKSLVIKQKKA